MKSIFKRLFKSAVFSTLICWLAANYIRLVYYTNRKHMEFPESARPYVQGDRAAIFAFWHGRMLLMPMVRPPKRKVHVLISMHRDGEMIARTMHRFGLGTVRGSTSRGGATAAKNSIRAVVQNGSVVVTPDGPRGPFQKVHPGILAIARLAKVPVVPVTFSATRHKRMRTWDRFMLALPFGTIYYKIGAPLFEPTREALENQMVQLTQEVDIKAGM